ncbi:MAG TPA: alpha/beta hydrolase [Mycobacteriales bacterium]|jgi:pimeloyl-ACP methyl ester carboxylesterase|nr:alpha/beta hydrolase [Mycobacteriales bacterium]
MYFTATATADGVTERLFTLDDVPGVLWTPADAGRPPGAAGGPLILLGHGGGQHKRAPGLLARARRFVAAGFTVAAVDAPGHGDRPTAAREQRYAELARRVAAGEPLADLMTRENAELAAVAVPEWRVTLDALLDGGHAHGPVGYWGVSMGAGLGLPFVAADARIGAAVLGLAAGAGLVEAAARITVPVEFLLQWDDDVVPRAGGLALFDAFASAEKTLHANPGGHTAVPAFELDSAERFFRRHLSRADPR